jgi:hypothetical protein
MLNLFKKYTSKFCHSGQFRNEITERKISLMIHSALDNENKFNFKYTVQKFCINNFILNWSGQRSGGKLNKLYHQRKEWRQTKTFRQFDKLPVTLS